MKNSINVNPKREQIRNLDSLGNPDRTLIDYQKYHQDIGIALARHTTTGPGKQGDRQQ
ncbi:MAG: hypothetical protein GY757_55915 [bacterium]|nr:hypothetical protein [bacterium]